MSVFLLGGRSTTNRRIPSQSTNVTAVQTSVKRPLMSTTVTSNNRESQLTITGRRRALDLYGTKDVLISHEHMKKAQQLAWQSGAVCTFG